MDTGLHDFSPFGVESTITYLEPDELAWHVERVKEFPGKTIVLSHHQLFSAFSPIGDADRNGIRSACNPHLLTALGEIQAHKQIAAWFWGHEHSLSVYEPFAGLRRGRCIGHGAVPVFSNDDIYVPLDGLKFAPKLVDGTKLGLTGRVYEHGFSIIELSNDGSAICHYLSDRPDGIGTVYVEIIDCYFKA